jgi:outer membrane lipase/esterase
MTEPESMNPNALLPFASLRRAACRVALTVLCAAGLASCGGGDLVDPFEPERLVAFGDEASVITATGQKYSVNITADDLDDDADEDRPLCGYGRIWIQILADNYNFGFAECNPYTGEAPKAFTYARPNTGVAELAQQVASVTLGSGDLVTVYTGQKDIVDAYAQYPARSRSEVTAIAEAAGEALARQVLALTRTGARVLFATVPDQGETPFAKAEDAANPDSDIDRDALLTDLTTAFNDKLLAGLSSQYTSGREVGLVELDDLVGAVLNRPSSYGYDNVDDAICTVALPACTTDTLIDIDDDEDYTDYLWADDRHFGTDMHRRMGERARYRAENNPF